MPKMQNETDLVKMVWNENAVCQLLGVKKISLRSLRTQHGLPMRRLQIGAYVCLADELLAWIRTKNVMVSHEDSSPTPPTEA
jgi:hypothetical protein